MSKKVEGFKTIYVDTETTGLYKDRNEIVQLAAIVDIDGVTRDECNIFMRPLKLHNVQQEALNVQGKTLEQLLKYPARAVGYMEWTKFLDKHVDKYDKNDKFIWIGQCPEFDIGFTREFMKSFNNEFFGSYFDRRAVDLVGLSVVMKMRGLINPRNFKLETIAGELGIEYKAHDALEDIRTTRKIVSEFLGWINKPGMHAKQITLI